MANTILHLFSHPAITDSKNYENALTDVFPTYFHLHYEEGKQSFLLNMIGAKEADYAYTIKDIHGNIFQKGEISTMPEDFQLSISLPNILQGIYTFRLDAFDGSQSYISRFFVNDKEA